MFHGCEVRWRIGGADAAFVIPECHVHDLVQAIFNAPMIADRCCHDRSIGNERGDIIPRFMPRRAARRRIFNHDDGL